MQEVNHAIELRSQCWLPFSIIPEHWGKPWQYDTR